MKNKSNTPTIGSNKNQLLEKPLIKELEGIDIYNLSLNNLNVIIKRNLLESFILYCLKEIINSFNCFKHIGLKDKYTEIYTLIIKSIDNEKITYGDIGKKVDAITSDFAISDKETFNLLFIDHLIHTYLKLRYNKELISHKTFYFYNIIHHPFSYTSGYKKYKSGNFEFILMFSHIMHFMIIQGITPTFNYGEVKSCNLNPDVNEDEDDFSDLGKDLEDD